MRGIVAGFVALAFGWFVYAVSPYYTLYRLGRAVEANDVGGISERVNIRAVRFSLARQLAADITAMRAFGSGIATPEAELAAGAALVLASPIFDKYGTPGGLGQLLRTSPGGEPGSVFGRDGVDLDDLDDFLSASTWRGFRNLYVALPPGHSPETRFRLQLRLSGLRWRLVALEVPLDLRRRIVEALLASR